MKKLLLITGLISFEVFAQTNTAGYMFGSVSTTKGDGVSNCEINLLNEDNGTRRSANMNADGSFRVSALTVGKYTVTAECDGYNTASLEHLRVNVGTGTNAAIVVQQVGSDTEQLDSMTVVGGKISAIDISSVESTSIFTEETYDRLPVPRNTTAISLLAPGTTGGDNAFGNLASFGGSSVGENSYYINGMNVTNFQNGLGGSTVPFEFYQEFQVKTGGYGAEFGHSTGGVVNAITKSGTNEWKFGAGFYYSPDSFTKTNPNVYRQDGTIISENLHDYSDNLNYYVEVGGPIIEDKLFFYGLYNPRDITARGIGITGDKANYRYGDSSTTDAFWGLKVDWYVADNHKLELTAFSDKRDVVNDSYNYDGHANQKRDKIGTSISKRGGQNYLLKYTGYLTPDFTLSALYGENEYDRTDSSPVDETSPLIIDARANSPTRGRLGTWVNGVPGTSFDKRKQYRLDAEWAGLDNHLFRFGLDYEKNNSTVRSFYSGHLYWRYVDATPGDVVQGGVVPEGVTALARKRIFEGGGSFDVVSGAFYIEDTWSVTNDITLSLGLRNEYFDNKNAAGESFIKIDNQIAPRLGFTWDVNGEGNSKVFATLGRYHLPIASNTNVRLSGAELFTQEYFLFSGDLDGNGLPIGVGDQVGSTAFFGDGTVPDAEEIRDSSIKPMYQDELILGYEKEIFDGVRAGVRYIYRDLKSTIEDVAIDAALNAYAQANGFSDFEAGGFDYYVLTNPGTDMDINIDLDGDGTLEDIHLTKEQLGYPDSKRTYKAFEFYFEKVWDGVYQLQGSYTYASSRGNNEGYVRSDNGQDDAGLTTLFDQPGLLDGAYGDLPNDRPHTIKLFGSWEFRQDWQLGFNSLFTSGRPINAFGVHPTDVFAAAYGSESFYQNGELVPRGTRGRTPFRTQFDLSLQYTHDFGWRDSVGTFRVDIFNLFNSHTVTEVNENAETDTGSSNPNYLLPTGFQTPQYVRFSANFRF